MRSGARGGARVGAGKPRPRAREIGLAPGVFEPGPRTPSPTSAACASGTRRSLRAITSAPASRPSCLIRQRLSGQGAGAVFVGNAFGKLAGSTQVDELGTIETPIVLTNTLSVGAVDGGLVRWTLAAARQRQRAIGQRARRRDQRRRPERYPRSPRPAAARARRIAAPRPTGPVPRAASAPAPARSAFGWKGGIGTSSRVLAARYGGYTVGVLVQSNFGGVLTMEARRSGRSSALLTANRPTANGPTKRSRRRLVHDCRRDRCAGRRARLETACRARRVRARAHGASFSNGSGDFAIAFSTAPDPRRSGSSTPVPRAFLPADGVSPLLEAALEATEEAVYNSLFQATSVTSRSGKSRSAPAGTTERNPQPLPQATIIDP